ncbi:hypothetical protein NGM37_41095, partial [Streptomyces sp. TRM76130]|nr:hypothetical protein [Streptomyces sp. TRM76130]
MRTRVRVPRRPPERWGGPGESGGFRCLGRQSLTAYDQEPEVLSAGPGGVSDPHREKEAPELLPERPRPVRVWRESVTEYHTPGKGPGAARPHREITRMRVDRLRRHRSPPDPRPGRARPRRRPHLRGGAEPFAGVLREGAR